MNKALLRTPLPVWIDMYSNVYADFLERLYGDLDLGPASGAKHAVDMSLLNCLQDGMAERDKPLLQTLCGVLAPKLAHEDRLLFPHEIVHYALTCDTCALLYLSYQAEEESNEQEEDARAEAQVCPGCTGG